VKVPFASAPAAALAMAASLAGCGPAPVAQGINDPDEAQNRQTHEFNRALDRAFFRPASGAYGGAIPEPVRQGVSNFAANLDLPGDVLNSIAQGRAGPAAENTLRFALNATVGIGGLFDPARALGLNGRPTDFGETLHVWGVAEGAYHELPLLGPSTDRDTVGALVDFALNPLRLALPRREANAAVVASFGSTLGDRYRFADTFDSILYESADSYAQTRLLYLQNRRFQLGQTATDAAGEDFVDPYEDPYAP
jgi:phospholipid-binding lipoprotein MlaA